MTQARESRGGRVPRTLLSFSASSCYFGTMKDTEPSEHRDITAIEAQRLLETMPPRPRRVFSAGDHLSAIATIALSFTSGLLALSGFPWWAIPLALGAIVTSNVWISKRLSQPNEPRLKGTFISAAFAVWLLIPVWRGLVHGETVPFPEAFIFAGLAPAAWLVFYVVLLIRR